MIIAAQRSIAELRTANELREKILVEFGPSL